MDKKTLGAFIALLRKEKGLTQRQLAELLNVSDKTVSHWECDENSPDISILPFLAEALGVSVDELLRGERKIIQPTIEQHYTTPKSEGTFDKSNSFATRTINKIRGKMSGNITEKYRYFRILSLIGTAIAAVVLLGITLTVIVSGTVLDYYMSADMLLLPGIVMFIGSLWTLAVSLGFTYGARLAFSKGMYPADEAAEEEKKYIFKANGLCFNNTFLVFCSLPMAFIGPDLFGYSVLITVPATVALLTVLWLVLALILNKKGILRSDKRKRLALRYLSIFALSFILVAGSLWFITEEVWFPSAEYSTFDNAEDFKAYMETPKEKPADSWRIDGVTATIAISNGIIIEEDSDYVRTEKVYGDAPGGVIVEFAWHNKEVYSYSYNAEDKTFSIITYDAKINQKDMQIAVDDGVPVIIVIYLVVDALICLFLYKKKINALTEM